MRGAQVRGHSTCNIGECPLTKSPPTWEWATKSDLRMFPVEVGTLQRVSPMKARIKNGTE